MKGLISQSTVMGQNYRKLVRRSKAAKVDMGTQRATCHTESKATKVDMATQRAICHTESKATKFDMATQRATCIYS